MDSMRLGPCCLVLFTLLVASLPLHAAEGGGYLDAGLDGEYFATPDLSGTAAFSRRDVRLNFDWGAPSDAANPLHVPGGSISPAYTAVGATNWSARWTGRLMPRFSETYTFSVDASAGVRVFIRAAGSANWTTLVDAWSAAGAQNVATALTAGTAYDFRVEYRQAAGAARLRVAWSSPSTPAEAIEAASQAGVNLDTYSADLYADAVKSGRDEWRDAAFGDNTALWPARDADGWPLGDGGTIVWEGQPRYTRAGTYNFRFEGRAQVVVGFNYGTFHVGSTTYSSTLPFGAGYDAATNTTTATIEINNDAEILYLYFTQTRRLPTDTTATGVRKVQLMRPLAPGGTTASVFGTVCHPPLSHAVRRFTTVRWIMNFETERQWSDRLRPGYCVGYASTRRFFEYMVMQANETGKDLYVCTPHRATDDYLLKLAQLIRYGSDGVNPYTAPQANPLYPPLNPNLRVYIERSNEIWNWGFTQAGENGADSTVAVANDTADGRAINFDGRAGSGNFARWHALKTAQISTIFRGVFGDAAMGDRVRILLEYQYDNGQGTATTQLQFLDDYFNNARGTSPLPAAQQHPVPYFVWGGGGALYYGAGNPMGYQSSVTVPNASFESPAIAAGTTGDAPAGWTVANTAAGSAGLYRAPALADAVGSPAGGTAIAPATPHGFRFTVGARPLYVNALGRWVGTGNSRAHTVSIVRVSNRGSLVSAEVATAGVAPGQYAYGTLNAPVTLEPNTAYYLFSNEDGTDTCLDPSATIATAAGFTIDGAVSAVPGDPGWDPATWTVTLDQSGTRSYGPLTFRYTTDTVAGLGACPWPRDGDQAAYILDEGELSTSIDFPQTGTFAIAFDCAATRDNNCTLRLFLDNQEITPDRQGSGLPGRDWGPGAWARDGSALLEYTSAPVTLTTTGARTLRVVSVSPLGLPGKFFIDHLRVVSVDAIFASGIPGAGQANGQIGIDNYAQQLCAQGRYAQTYGLRVTAYEGGWSLGGDFGTQPVQQWAKYYDPRARDAQHRSIDLYARSGGTLYTFGTYDQWYSGDTPHADTYQLTLGIDDRNATLPLEPSFGFALPHVLAPVANTYALDLSGNSLASRGAFVSWNVIAPQRADYLVTTASATAGGRAQLYVDGWPVGATAPGGTAFARTVALGKGLHTVQVRSVDAAAFVVDNVTITLPSTLAPPTGLAATDADARVALAWNAVGGATGYRVLWGTVPGQPDNSLDVPAGTLATTITGLTNNLPYYFSVATLTAAGPGLPSTELGRTPFADGQQTALALWQFVGIAGDEPAEPATATSSRVTATSLVRGGGLKPGGWFGGATFAAYIETWPTSLAAAKTGQSFFTFSLAPAGGRRLSLTELDLTTFMQNASAGSDCRAALAYSVDGGATFSDIALATPTGNYTDHTIDLSGIAALQNTTATVVFRSYFWGLQGYCTAGLGQSGNPAIRIVGSVATALPPLAAWRQANFGTTTNSGSAADAADPDGDGVTNILEYATGTDPNFGSVAPTSLGDSAGHLTLAFTRLRDATDITYHVEASTDLVAWTELWNSADNAYTGSAPSAPQLVVDPQPSAGFARRFLRLRIASPGN